MQTALSRIWTQVAVSISYDDNYYTKSILIIFSLWHKVNFLRGIKLGWGSLHGVVANVPNCNILVSLNFSYTIMFTFGLILGKIWTLPYPPPQLLVK